MLWDEDFISSLFERLRQSKFPFFITYPLHYDLKDIMIDRGYSNRLKSLLEYFFITPESYDPDAAGQIYDFRYCYVSGSSELKTKACRTIHVLRKLDEAYQQIPNHSKELLYAVFDVEIEMILKSSEYPGIIGVCSKSCGFKDDPEYKQRLYTECYKRFIKKRVEEEGDALNDVEELFKIINFVYEIKEERLEGRTDIIVSLTHKVVDLFLKDGVFFDTNPTETDKINRLENSKSMAEKMFGYCSHLTGILCDGLFFYICI